MFRPAFCLLAGAAASLSPEMQFLIPDVPMPELLDFRLPEFPCFLPTDPLSGSLISEILPPGSLALEARPRCSGFQAALLQAVPEQTIPGCLLLKSCFPEFLPFSLDPAPFYNLLSLLSAALLPPDGSIPPPFSDKSAP
mgnify:CR=1 FL=1